MEKRTETEQEREFARRGHSLKIDFAPLEGITDTVYRRLHRKYFGGVDRYYIPFISPTGDHLMTPKDVRELSPEDGFPESMSPAEREEHLSSVVPQFLTKNAEDFLFAAEYAQEIGYRVVNLNTGCPSGTVTAKGKGAGMLRDPEALDRFLDAVFEKATVRVSVKTRIGMTSPDEFPAILAVFCRYPLAELILHPRTGAEMYRGGMHPEAFAAALAACPFPVTFNGNLTTAGEVWALAEEYPRTARVMIGRGLVGDPAFALRVSGSVPEPEEYRRGLCAFLGELTETYRARFGNDRAVLFRMKDVWRYLLPLFLDDGRAEKRFRKARTLAELSDAAEAVLSGLAFAAENS